MYKILEKEQMSETVYRFKVEAAKVAAKVEAGQFFLLRANETGERVPFTFADWDAQEGWIEFIIMTIGKTTDLLATFEEGESFLDITGPLGNPSHISDGRWAVVGGGVGLAAAYPVTRALCAAGAEVTVIMGARNESLLLLEDKFKALPIKELVITTDDGSKGEKAVVTVPLERMYQEGTIDHSFAVGPIPMMKFSALTAKKYNQSMLVSLNPIMLDGTGMCGGCRCNVGGNTYFVCCDGPDFEGTEVDWNDLGSRSRGYWDQQVEDREAFGEECKNARCVCKNN